MKLSRGINYRMSDFVVRCRDQNRAQIKIAYTLDVTVQNEVFNITQNETTHAMGSGEK